MQTAISIPPFTDVETVVALAVEAEEAGWDATFLWDHLVWRGAGLPVHDPWVLLGVIASRTSRVRVGTMITPLSRRRPWIVAKHLTTLDAVSGGRAVLGVGLGAPAGADFADFGEVSADRERAALLDEGLTVLDGLLSGPVSHAGPAYRVSTEIFPRPVQRPRPPIWVAAVAPHRRPLERASRWDGVAAQGPDGALRPDGLARYLEGAPRRDGWDVVSWWAPGVPAAEYTDAGATWLVVEPSPRDGEEWIGPLRERIRRGPV